MAAFKSKMPAGEDLSPQMIAWLQSIEKQASAETPFDVDPVTPGSTSVVVTNRTVTDAANVGTGSDNGILGAGAAIQTYYDSFTTIKNVLNTFNTNLTNLKTAVDALNVRVTALENKDNEIITALTPS